MSSLQLADVVQCRSEEGRDYGVVLLPEGLIEFVPEVGSLIAEINEILAKSPDTSHHGVADFLTPASRQVPHESCPVERLAEDLLTHRAFVVQ